MLAASLVVSLKSSHCQAKGEFEQCLSDGSIANKERNVEYNGLVSCKDIKE